MMAVLDRHYCPECGTPIRHEVIHQPALFIACGYGATRRTTVRYCQACGWTLNVETQEVRPL